MKAILRVIWFAISQSIPPIPFSSLQRETQSNLRLPLILGERLLVNIQWIPNGELCSAGFCHLIPSPVLRKIVGRSFAGLTLAAIRIYRRLLIRTSIFDWSIALIHPRRVVDG